MISTSRPAMTPARPAVHSAGASTIPVIVPDDSDDFSTIDSEAKAALMPALLVGRELLGNTVESAAQNGNAFRATISWKAGDSTEASINYVLMNNQQSMESGPALIVSGQGTVGGAAFNELWSADSKSNIGWNTVGTIGNSTEMLQRTSQPDGTHIDGHIGQIEVHLVGNDVPQGLKWQGTVGSKALRQTMTVTSDSKVHVEGTLGDDKICYDQTETGSLPADSTTSGTLQLSGQGVVAGTPITMNQSFTVTPQIAIIG